MDSFPKDVPVEDLRDGQIFYVDIDDSDENNNNNTTTLHVLFTPGHAADHCCFWLEEENGLFTADCVLGHGSVVFNDLYNYMASLKKLEQLAPTKLYPGHGVVVENGLSRIRQYIKYREERESQIVDLMRNQKPDHGGDWTASDIARSLYVFFLIINMIKKKIMTLISHYY